MNKPSILVVEDDPSVRNLITTTLKTNDYRYVVAPNGSAAIMEATSHNPEIILLDLGLPDMDGVQVIQTVRSWSNVPIIVISARSEDNDKIKALDAGADDYLPKPFDMGELLARVRAMLRRREEFHPDLLSFGDLTLNIQSSTLGCRGMEFVLPKQEYRLMEQLMANHNIFLSTEDLLVKAWGYDAETDINSVWLYISYLRKRLAAMNSSVRIVSKRNIGYRLENPL